MFFFSYFVFSKESEINGIFKKHYNDNIIVIDVSGSSKQYINGSTQLTKPEYAIYPYDKKYDWCSNCARSYDVHPWIAFSMKGRKFKINGYFIRCGCCYEGCCCENDGYACIDCCLFSWSLQISDDNKTWTDVHKVESDYDMRRCNEKSYKLDKEYTSKYVRIIQNQPCPGDPPCIAINRMELIGDAVPDDGEYDNFVSYHDDDDDISIIGHISKNGNVRIE